jgi:orotate phosphoribosyltransferase
MTAKRTSQVLLERLIDTNGFAVRKSSNDGAFWYTSGKPGPFYINTQNIAGEHGAEAALEKINHILKADHPKEAQAKAIFEVIQHTIANDESYDNSINALVDYYISHSSHKPIVISGGERRDWFFSIPFAKKLNLPHICLFKSGEYLVTDHEGNTIELDVRGSKVLHVADIINLASSYTNRWIPMLKHAGTAFTETLSVAVRSQEGVQNLKANHVSVISPLIVERPLFKEAFSLGLINEFAYNEIISFYDSPEDWTRRFIIESDLDNSNLNSREMERLEVFKKTDPYQLKSELPAFFT